ncbi:MAG: ATP synthase subunit I [Legionellaceae bacterium]|nr:ATP synthase subunit I [Legionellaceae bacterium]
MFSRYGVGGVRLLFLIQLSLAMIVSIIAGAFLGKIAAQSAMLGAFTYIIPNAFYARKMFRHKGAKSAKKIVNSFYKAEALKFALSMVLFAAVFVLCNINPLIFFGAYISMQVVIWFAPLIFN